MYQLTNTSRQMLCGEGVLLCALFHSALHSSYHRERWNSSHFTQSLNDFLDFCGQQGTEAGFETSPQLFKFPIARERTEDFMQNKGKPSTGRLYLQVIEYRLEMAYVIFLYALKSRSFPSASELVDGFLWKNM